MSTGVSFMNKWGARLCIKKIKTSWNVPNAKAGQYMERCAAQDLWFSLKSTNSILCAPLNWANSETSVRIQPNSHRFLTCSFSLSLTLLSMKTKLQRSLVWNGSRMCSNSRDDPSTPCSESVLGKSVLDGEVVFFFFFSYLTLPMERSQPIENNKVRNLTLMKEMRKRKRRSLGTSVHGGKKGRMRSG